MYCIKFIHHFNKGFVFFIVNISILAALWGCSPGGGQTGFNQIEKGFISSPDTILTSVYWYWISDNISKEGVVKDLESMKKVGINRAFIGNIGLNPGEPPYGNVKIFSDEWWDILHTALKKATELGIEIGIFNSPGWSQSGGPWINPEEAMSYLSFSELQVKGPQKLIKKLENPAEIFRDVKVIAYPIPKDNGLFLDTRNATIGSTPKVSGLGKLTDGDKTTGIIFPETGEFIFDLKAKQPFTARSLCIRPTENKMYAKAELQVKDAGGEFRTLSSFEINRSNTGLNVGFNPYAPVVVSFPATTATHFRVVFKNIKPQGGLAEVTLSASPRVERYAEKTLAKMHPTPLPYWHDYMWAQQPEIDGPSMVIDVSKVSDISDFMSEGGTLTWDVPEGEWVIMRTGKTPTGVKNSPATPEATGYEVDKMSKKNIEKHFNCFIGEIMKRIPEPDRKCFKVVVQDSYEMGGQNWTDGFCEIFKSRYGYDPLPFLPVFQGYVVQSREISDRFLWDVRRLVADKVAYDYVGGLREVSHKNGLTTWLENYGHWGFPGEFLQYGGQSDEVSGEFWSERDLGNIENRAASSCAHIYGKRKVSAESFTCSGAPFSRYPLKMKQRGDRFFTEGINNTLLHVFIQQPYEDKFPGMNAWFGNEFNRKNTWFYDMDMFIRYLKRCNFMLQQGNYVADVAYFIGEDVPKMTGICDPPLPQGYSFDYINGEVIRERLTVRNGKLVLPDGMEYSILVLPQLETIRPELLEKIADLAEQGAVVLGPAPKRSPSLENYPEADAKVQELAATLWGNINGVSIKSSDVGKGKILSGMNMQEALDFIRVKPDCKMAPADSLLFIHRTLSGGDLYFISNQSGKTVTVSPEFRISGKQPELWDAVTGSVRPLPAFEEKDGSTIVPLKLEALESAFVIFRKNTGAPQYAGIESNYPDSGILTTLSQPWEVSFSGLGGPVKPVVFETLADWAESANDSIKYFSGTAIYRAEVNLPELPAGHRLFLNLGKVSALAKVRVNGEDAGGVWTAPWQVDVSGLLKAGNNVVEISVTNTWVNRLIGDSRLPENERLSWCPINRYKPESPLQPSGLFGPVTIQDRKY